MSNRRPVHVEVIAREKESGERLINRFLKKVKKTKFLEKVNSKRFYEKPSLKRKKQQEKRLRVLRKLERERETRKNKFYNYRWSNILSKIKNKKEDKERKK